MFVRGFLTTIPDNNAVPNDTSGEVRLDSDNSLLGTVSTVGGWFEFSMNGSPGQFHIVWDYNDIVREQYSKIVGPSGPVDVAGIPYLFRTMRNGTIEGVGSGLPVTATGVGMVVNIGTGYAVVEGLLYDHRTASTVPITAAHATLGRRDYVVVEVVPAGVVGGTEGRSRIVVVAGTPASTPVLPTLTQTSSLWQHPLATVVVSPAASVITSGDVSSVAVFTSGLIPNGSIGFAQLAPSVTWNNIVVDDNSTILASSGRVLDFRRPLIATVRGGDGASIDIAPNSITAGEMASNSVGAVQIIAGAVGTDELTDSSVTAAKIATDAVGAAAIIAGAVGTAELASASVTSVKIAAGAVGTAELASASVTSVKIAAGAVVTAGVADEAITLAKMAPGVIAGASSTATVGMTLATIAATGVLTSGSRTLATLAITGLTTGETYKIVSYGGTHVRNNVSNGTISMSMSINAVAATSVGYTTVGGVPSWCPIAQVIEVVAPGTSVNAVLSCADTGGDDSDFRTGFVVGVAVPKTIVVG